MSRALVAMSGGVDSSVALFLMKEQGYNCTGITMKLYNNEDIGESRQKACCTLEDVEDARSVAFSLGIPFYVLNFTADFKSQVIDRFINSYEIGATPNPCIDCNRYIKFDKLFLKANQLEMDYTVTGHYARIEKDKSSGRYLLKKAADITKDQSYVLYSMTQEQLAKTVFPLGNLNKTEVREIAEKMGFVNSKKKDSQDICFVRDGDYAKFIEMYTGTNYPEGNFVDTAGNIVGTHKGIIRYTIGQRKGLGLSMEKPVYVSKKNIENNTVTVGEEKDLYSKTVFSNDFNWIAYENISKPIKVKAKTRYNQKEQWATAVQISKDKVLIEFDQPQRAVAKGQAVVLYEEDVVIGGGTIL